MANKTNSEIKKLYLAVAHSPRGSLSCRSRGTKIRTIVLSVSEQLRTFRNVLLLYLNNSKIRLGVGYVRKLLTQFPFFLCRSKHKKN